MAAPRIDVDREQVRMLAITIGVREAARQMGLPEKTVLAWSHREGWLAGCKPTPLQPLPLSMKSRAVNAIKRPVDALIDSIKEDGKATRVAVMKYAKRVTKFAAKEAKVYPDKALCMASDVKSAVQSAALAGEWAVQSGSNGGVTVVVGLQVVGRPDQFETLDEGATYDLPE